MCPLIFFFEVLYFKLKVQKEYLTFLSKRHSYVKLMLFTIVSDE